MLYVLAGFVGVLLIGYLYSLFANGKTHQVLRLVRYVLGGGALAIGGFLILVGRIGIGSMIGLAGAGILRHGRLGPIDLGAGLGKPDNSSRVKSRYLEMSLDHDTGAVDGTVRQGQFARAALIDLDADQSWQLYNEVADDPDSLALYESWLNANRAGWENYFAEHYGFAGGTGQAHAEDANEGAHASGQTRTRDELSEAYDILGLAPGASAEDVRKAHRELMKRVHPDHGGSSYLASRINRAKEQLLEEIGRKA